MRTTVAYRRLRREVHDVLEVGGDAHPMGRVVNGFIIVLIFLNAIAFAADTVPELAHRYAWEFAAFNLLSVLVD
jgi:voltage-gated potassium channel